MTSFLETSSIHGFKYLTKNFNMVERIFWAISLIFSAVCASILIFEVIVKIKTFPIVSFVSDQSVPIEQIDFPAVTVCSGLSSKPVNASGYPLYEVLPFGSYESHTMKMTSYINDQFLTNLAKEDFKIVGKDSFLKLLQKLERFEVKAEDLNERILNRLHVIDLISQKGVFKRLNISIPVDNFLFHSNYFEKFNLKIYRLTWSTIHVILSEIITEYGFCYSFNLAIPENIFNTDLVAADFYHDYIDPDPIEKKDKIVPKSIGANENFLAHITTYQTFYDDVFFGDWEGHKIYVHSPYEHPTRSHYQFIMPKSGSSYLYIEPQLFITDESLYDMEPIDRNCYLKHEKTLKFYKIYTEHNCEHECLADWILKRCGCVEFYMIRNFTTRICSAIEKDCFDEARNNFEQHKDTCKCLQPCNYMKYTLELRPDSMDPKVHAYKYLYHSVTHFRLVGSQVSQFIRKKQFDEVDFLSFVGGLLGLFAGFSALSFVEIIYWIFNKIRNGILMRKHQMNTSNIIEVKECQPTNDIEMISKSSTQPKSFVQGYFSESSIHGFIYLTKLNTFETIFWLLALIFSLSLCVTLIAETNQKVPDSRVVSIDENIESIKTIPFPAVTYSTFNFIDNNFYNRLVYLSDTNGFGKLKSTFEKYPRQKQIFMKKLLIFQMAQSIFGYPWDAIGLDAEDITEDILKETSSSAYYKNQYATFNNKLKLNFSEVPLKNLLGISFNLMDANELIRLDEVGELVKYNRTISLRSVPDAYELPASSYPIHMSMKDRQFEFVLKLAQHPGRYDRNLAPYGSPTLSIHPVDVYPNFIFRLSSVTPLYENDVTLDVTPEITRTDESLRSLDPKTRECYFEDEKHLRFFKIYTEENCRGECLTNVTFQTCGCVLLNQIYSPKLGMKFCHKISEFKCAYYDVIPIYKAQEKNCFCLPSCNSITYNFKYSAYPSDDMGQSTTIVRMSMENAILYRRYQQFTFSDVVSYVGGLLGLFAGISFLSFFEIVYFFTLRFFCEIWREWKKDKRSRAVGC